MTDAELRARVCGDKRDYGDPAEAWQVRRRMIAQGFDAEPLRAYRCPLCRRFHLGHPPSLETLEGLARLIRGLPSASS